MRRPRVSTAVGLVAAVLVSVAPARPAPAHSAAATSSDTTEAEAPSAIEVRRLEEEKVRTGAFSITPHRQVYFLLATYNGNPNERSEFVGDDGPSHLEAKFQLSFRIMVWEDVLGGPPDLFAAYTQLSLWQVYDKALSSPFRETNYEPEIFLAFDTEFPVFGLRNRLITAGLVHESNGQGVAFSRSWNRLFTTFVADRGRLAVLLKAWYRIPEDDDEDDNPDIVDTMGHGELYGAYRLREHVFSFLFRNNLRGEGNKGAVEIGWSHPLTPNTRVYLQYFNGYGESLIDYDHPVNRISAGAMLFDWL